MATAGPPIVRRDSRHIVLEPRARGGAAKAKTHTLGETVHDVCQSDSTRDENGADVTQHTIIQL